jgi:hypothetical protein
MGLVVIRDTGHFQEREGHGGCTFAVTRRKSRVAGKRCRTCGQFPMHINGDKTHQQAVRHVLMAGGLAIDFRAARQICCRGLGCSTTIFVEQDNCYCYFGSGIEADVCSALYYIIM